MSEPRPPDDVLGYHARGGASRRLEEAYLPLEASRARLPGLPRRVEREPSLLGASPHLLAAGRR